MRAVKEPRMSLTLCSYELLVRAHAGAFHVTCPELPQLFVRACTIGQALLRAQEAIDAILAGRVLSWAS